ncbi:hypothetical protein Sjap_012375 [Stephania japonica]|uniref:AB hydrolase-1 domain-containing protein n=1 Tax=Stephania japonica TaxID=461633 RepID=A0AAP0IVY6_9MAGN
MSSVGGKVSAASAGSHTRKSHKNSSSGMFKRVPLLLFLGVLSWAYQAIQIPPPKLCGSPEGPPVTAPRIELRDGRYLAYKEHGVLKNEAKYKIVFIHGFDSCRHDAFPMSKELAEDLGIYMVSFDRAGYGESDANYKRTLKSTALDIEELADNLGLGSKFFVLGYSMGGQVVWTCLKYIPHRLAGAALVAPVVNYWWPGFPANVSKDAYYDQLGPDQWALRVAHYAPWLTYWWNTQNLFPSSSVAAHDPRIFSPPDMSVAAKFEARPYADQITQQGKYGSHHLDMIIGFGSWEFDPMDLKNPFPNNEGSVHLWHGDEDLLVPVKLQRYIAQKLPWIHYHELTDAGHLFPLADGLSDRLIKSLLVGDK